MSSKRQRSGKDEKVGAMHIPGGERITGSAKVREAEPSEWPVG